MEERIKRIKKWLKGIKQPPLILQIGPTLKCNQNCLFCSMYNKKRNLKEITLKDYRRIIDEAGRIGINEVRVVGEGEPLLYNNIIKLMGRIKKKGMFGFLVTNGIAFNEKIIKEMIKIKWDFIVISLESTKPRIHDILVNKSGSFSKIIKNIRLINNLKRNNKPKISINTTLTNKNYKEITNMLYLADKLKIERVTFEPLIIKNKYCNELTLNNKQKEILIKIIKKTQKKTKELKIETNLNELLKFKFLEKKEIKRCYNPFFYFSINASGQVGFCGDFSNINKKRIKKKEIMDIWNSEWFNKYREYISNGKEIPQCSNCCTPFIAENNKMDESIQIK